MYKHKQAWPISGRRITNSRYLPLIVFIIPFFVTCKTTPVIPQSFMQEEKYLPLAKGASVYLFANVIEARSILALLPIGELKEEQTAQLLDRTGMAVAALFPMESGKRFQLAAWGNYPSFSAGFAFSFNKNWKNQRSSTGGSYWYSAVNKLSINLTSKQAFAAASLIDTPFEPQTAPALRVEIPDGFNDFRAGSPLSCWLSDPASVISDIFQNAGIPVQFPVQELFINLFPAENGCHALLRFQLENAPQARGMAAMLNLAGVFISGGSVPLLNALLFANAPVLREHCLEIKTGVLSDDEMLLVFKMFFGI